MDIIPNDIREIASREYKYGFVTDLETDAAPRGLNAFDRGFRCGSITVSAAFDHLTGAIRPPSASRFRDADYGSEAGWSQPRTEVAARAGEPGRAAQPFAFRGRGFLLARAEEKRGPLSFEEACGACASTRLTA